MAARTQSSSTAPAKRAGVEAKVIDDLINMGFVVHSPTIPPTSTLIPYSSLRYCCVNRCQQNEWMNVIDINHTCTCLSICVCHSNH
jgi:hypothetical protein